MIRHEDLVRAAARFLTQIGDVQMQGRTDAEIGYALRLLAAHIAPAAGEVAPTLACCDPTTFRAAP